MRTSALGLGVAIVLLVSCATQARATTLIYVLDADGKFAIVATDRYAHQGRDISAEVSKIFHVERGKKHRLLTTYGIGGFAPPSVQGHHPPPILFQNMIRGGLDPAHGLFPAIQSFCDWHFTKPLSPKRLVQKIAECWPDDTPKRQGQPLFVHEISLAPIALSEYTIVPTGGTRDRVPLFERSRKKNAVFWRRSREQEIRIYGLQHAIARMVEGRDHVLQEGVYVSRMTQAVGDRKNCLSQERQLCLSRVLQGEYPTIAWEVPHRERLLDLTEKIKLIESKGQAATNERAELNKELVQALTRLVPRFDALPEEILFLEAWGHNYRSGLDPDPTITGERGQRGTISSEEFFDLFRLDFEYEPLTPQDACRLACILLELQLRMLRMPSASRAGALLGEDYGQRSGANETPKFDLRMLYRDGDEVKIVLPRWNPKEGVCENVPEG